MLMRGESQSRWCHRRWQRPRYLAMIQTGAALPALLGEALTSLVPETVLPMAAVCMLA